MYSSNGVRRVLRATNPEDSVLVATASTPNTSQFGWTSNDLTSVKDLAQWVSEAQNAAESASANAQYSSEVLVHVQDQANIIDAQMIDLDTRITEFNETYTVFLTQYSDFLVKYEDFINKYNEWVNS